MFVKAAVSLALAATVVTGGPLFQRGGGDTWKNPKGGNLDVYLSDKKINWGSANPSDVINKLLDHCHADGTCDPDFSVDSSWTTTNGNNPLEKGSVKIAITDAQFEVWAKNGIVEAMKTAMGKVQTVDHTEWTAAPACGGDICAPPGKPNKIDQFKGPESINIQIRDKTGGLKDFIHVTATPHIDDSESGLCGTLVGIGGAMAGLINGAVGGIFSLANLGCLMSGA